MPRRVDVRHTYERIGPHFARTRAYAWPEVESFVADASVDSPEAVGLDLGCGNCRHAETLATRVDRVVGLDASRSLLEAGRTRAGDRDFGDALTLCQGDVSTLPFRADAVDLAVYVATLHHLPSRDDRRASLDELARVLAPTGRGLVSAWSTAHDRFEDHDATAAEGFDTTVEWTLRDGETVDRFYHIYAPAEFEADLEASGLEIVEWELSSGNCYATVSGRTDVGAEAGR